MNKNAEPIFLI